MAKIIFENAVVSDNGYGVEVNTKLAPIIQNTADLVREDSIKAIQYIKEQLEDLQKEVPVSRNKDGYDIVANAKDRLAEYAEICKGKKYSGNRTGAGNQ